MPVQTFIDGTDRTSITVQGSVTHQASRPSFVTIRHPSEVCPITELSRCKIVLDGTLDFHGKVVQIGRPEEVVGAPADDYVADFVSDVPRSHVLTLRWIMRPLEPGDPTDGPAFDASAVIRSCLEAAAGTDKPIRVIKDGHLLGVVDRARILGAVADTVGERLLGVMATGEPIGAGTGTPGAA